MYIFNYVGILLEIQSCYTVSPNTGTTVLTSTLYTQMDCYNASKSQFTVPCPDTIYIPSYIV